MTKSQAILLINKQLGGNKLKTRNTTFASISISGNRAAWWMNIKLENFKKDWNIVLAGEHEIFWLKIPANTFKNPERYFRIWESKNAADLLISSDRQERYFKDISSGGTEVDFKPFIIERFSIPEEMKILLEDKPLKTLRTKHESSSDIPSEIRKQRIIKQDQTNITYEKIFARYLKGADNIMLQDPWIRLPYQFNNLLEFCVMFGNNKEDGKEIGLEVVSWNSEEYLNLSKEYFEELSTSVQDLGVNLSYRLERHHDRFIEANNGNKIILGRGLDIFEKREGRFSIGDVDQRWRKCKACEITYLKM